MIFENKNYIPLKFIDKYSFQYGLFIYQVYPNFANVTWYKGVYNSSNNFKGVFPDIA